MKAELDLRQLTLERARTTAPRVAGGRSFVARYAVSGGIILGFLGLIAWAARDQLLPRKPVTVIPVVVSRSEIRQEGTPLFQAAGWIEPRPSPVLVTALTEGVVEKVLVVEGQTVEVDQPIAKLLDTDAKLALHDAEVALQLRQAELQSALAELKGARARHDQPAHLDVPLAEADSQLAKIETELAKIPFLIEAASARLEFAHRSVEGKQIATEAVAPRILQQAEADLATAKAELAELKQRAPRLEREAETLRRKHAALAKQRELLIDETRQLADAQAKEQAAAAKVEQAKLFINRHKLTVERTQVRSVMQGKVLQVVARPGTRVTAMEGSGANSSATIVTLYNPEMLQVRADVRLEDVAQVEANQPVRLETASSKEPLSGFVLQPTSIANIQKNTLEVKVAISNPPATIRPEMLVTATFLAAARPKSSEEVTTAQERLFLPKSLIESRDGQSTVWLIDASSNAKMQAVRVGQLLPNGLVEVIEGVGPTDKIISAGRDGLRNGDRVVTTFQN